MKFTNQNMPKEATIPNAAAISKTKHGTPKSMQFPAVDTASRKAAQAKQAVSTGEQAIQLDIDEEDLQMKTAQGQFGLDEDEETFQGKFVAQMKNPNRTGMPDELKGKMETAFNTDFSGVKVHANSSKAPEVGALAYTQGSDIHFAPGQFSPDTSRGQQLLGHELTHVVQQSEGRVQPTTEVAGLLVNDNPAFEKEADVMGSKAAG